MKRAPRLTKRERKALVRADPTGIVDTLLPCPEAGRGDGECCPSCGEPEVRVHTCSCCDEQQLECCACRHHLSAEETDEVMRVVASRTPSS